MISDVLQVELPGPSDQHLNRVFRVLGDFVESASKSFTFHRGEIDEEARLFLVEAGVSEDLLDTLWDNPNDGGVIHQAWSQAFDATCESSRWTLGRPRHSQDTNYHLVNNQTGDDHLIDIHDIYEGEPGDDDEESWLPWEVLRELSDIDRILGYVWKVLPA